MVSLHKNKTLTKRAVNFFWANIIIFFSCAQIFISPTSMKPFLNENDSLILYTLSRVSFLINIESKLQIFIFHARIEVMDYGRVPNKDLERQRKKL